MKPQGSILTYQTTPFIAVPNTRRLVAADPFLFTECGVTYLFAELFDKKDGRGKLGYAVFDGQTFSKWKVVIDEPYHLSYPNIFRYKGEIYIVPEANESETLYAYRATVFPDQWEKCSPLITGRRLVDTTFLERDARCWVFTYDLMPDNNKKLFRCEFQEDRGLLADSWRCISENDAVARPGGNFIRVQDKVIRVSQDCAKDYGQAIVFSEVITCNQDKYEEKEILRIAPKDIKLNKQFVHGVHTYNANDSLEVIDFHKTDFDPMTQIRRLISKLGLWK
ncbi:MAG: hypothetical protein IJK64_03365 [Clostridia bacterium]|nr:hypothetical protein [Clostridia bacterium]